MIQPCPRAIPPYTKRLMKKVLKWLVAPHTAPLVARLVLVVLAAFLTEPPLAASAGALCEAAVNRLAHREG